jgi:hypothetical protein
VGEGRHTPDMRRYTVRDAADMLEISTGAVRNRLSRGTLRSVKEGGTVYVLLPSSATDMSTDRKRDADDTPGGIPRSDNDALISAKDETIVTLREQLEAERQAHAEARRLLMAALERIPQAIEASEGTEPHPASEAEEAQESDQRPWWRRMWG